MIATSTTTNSLSRAGFRIVPSIVYIIRFRLCRAYATSCEFFLWRSSFAVAPSRNGLYWCRAGNERGYKIRRFPRSLLPHRALLDNQVDVAFYLNSNCASRFRLIWFCCFPVLLLTHRGGKCESFPSVVGNITIRNSAIPCPIRTLFSLLSRPTIT